jgi:hypothetical protein
MGLLGDFLPDLLPADPDKRAAAQAGLLNFGAQMMIHANKGLGGAAGYGLLGGSEAFQGKVEQQRKQALQDMQTKVYGVELQSKEAALAKQKRIEDAYRTYYSGNISAPTKIPGLLSDAATQAPSTLKDPGQEAAKDPGYQQHLQKAAAEGTRPMTPVEYMISIRPSDESLWGKPQYAAGGPNSAGIFEGNGAPGRNASPVNNYQRYISFAQHLESQGLGEEAQKYYDLAEKFRPKIKDQKTLMQNGKPVNVITYDDGRQEVSQFGALPDNQILNLGGKQVVVDKNQAQNGQTFINTQTPDSIASIQSAREGRAQSERHFQLGRVPQGYRVTEDGRAYEPIPGGPAALGKALPVATAKDLEAQTVIADSTQRLVNTFKDDFGGKTIMGNASNYAGRILGDETGQAQWWQDYSLHEAQVRNKLFGASLTVGEQAAWERTAVNPRMTPEQIKANLKRRQEIESAALARSMRSSMAAGYNKTQIEELTGRQMPEAEPKSGGKGGGQNRSDLMPSLPKANASNKGRTVLDHETGKRYRSNGMQWQEVN